MTRRIQVDAVVPVRICAVVGQVVVVRSIQEDTLPIIVNIRDVIIDYLVVARFL